MYIAPCKHRLCGNLFLESVDSNDSIYILARIKYLSIVSCKTRNYSYIWFYWLALESQKLWRNTQSKELWSVSVKELKPCQTFVSPPPPNVLTKNDSTCVVFAKNTERTTVSRSVTLTICACFSKFDFLTSMCDSVCVPRM